MNANELVTKAIYEGRWLSGGNFWDEPQEVERIASTLSAGLIVLTEERLKEIIFASITEGRTVGTCLDYGKEMANEYASRIMREVRGGE